MTDNSQKQNYIGWIPCVGGHLDFALIRPGIAGKFTGYSKDSVTSCANFSPEGQSDSHVRNIAIQSWVDWKDTIKDADGCSRVCLVAKVNQSNDLDARKLSGSVIIYPKLYEEKGKKHKARLLDKIHDLDFAVNSWDMRDADWWELFKFQTNRFVRKHLKRQKKKKLAPLRFNGWNEAQSAFNDKWSEIQERIPHSSSSETPAKMVLRRDAKPECYPNIYRVDFEVQPNGITKISFNDLGIHRTESDSINDEDRYVICRQAFYYIKFSLHTHKHHGNKQDAMTTIVQDNKHSGLRLLGQIKRELTGIKRIQRYKMQRHHSAESLGIIAYANSLCVALRQSELICDFTLQREMQRLKSLKSSFETQLDSLAENYRLKETLKSDKRFFTTLLTAGLSLLIILSVNLLSLEKLPTVPSFLLKPLLTNDSGIVYTIGSFAVLPLVAYGGISALSYLKTGFLSFWKWSFRHFLFHWLAVIVALAPAGNYIYKAFMVSSTQVSSQDEVGSIKIPFRAEQLKEKSPNS